MTISLGNLSLWGAKPESGLFLFVCCQLAFRLPSGVWLCTSERIECCCEAYALDAPALRFRGKEMNMNEEMNVICEMDVRAQFSGLQRFVAQSQARPNLASDQVTQN